MKPFVFVLAALVAFTLFVSHDAVHAQTMRQQENLQWVYAALVSYNTDVSLDGRPQMAWNSETWPYTIPAGKWLGITSIQFGSKFTKDYYMAGTGENRASYFLIQNIATVPDTTSTVTFKPPLVVQPSVTLHADFINNNFSEPEWMTSVVQAVLIDPPALQMFSYRDVFVGVTY